MQSGLTFEKQAKYHGGKVDVSTGWVAAVAVGKKHHFKQRREPSKRVAMLDGCTPVNRNYNRHLHREQLE